MPFAPLLPAVDRIAFFFDFDGTLCALAPTPDAVQVPAGVPGLLRQLRERNDRAVAIVTGRPIADIDHFLAPLVLPMAGSHGAERRNLQGEIALTGFGDARLQTMADALRAVVTAHAGLLLEVKGAGLALHYRAAPQFAGEAEAAMTAAIAPYGDDFVLQPGKMVFELKPKGVDKGLAIHHFMAQAPFAGRIPLFAGDDLTDEKGFAAVNALGGISIKIGDGDTLANIRLDSVDAFIAWLEALPGL